MRRREWLIRQILMVAGMLGWRPRREAIALEISVEQARELLPYVTHIGLPRVSVFGPNDPEAIRKL